MSKRGGPGAARALLGPVAGRLQRVGCAPVSLHCTGCPWKPVDSCSPRKGMYLRAQEDLPLGGEAAVTLRTRAAKATIGHLTGSLPGPRPRARSILDHAPRPAHEDIVTRDQARHCHSRDNHGHSPLSRVVSADWRHLLALDRYESRATAAWNKGTSTTAPAWSGASGGLSILPIHLRRFFLLPIPTKNLSPMPLCLDSLGTTFAMTEHPSCCLTQHSAKHKTAHSRSQLVTTEPSVSSSKNRHPTDSDSVHKVHATRRTEMGEAAKPATSLAVAPLRAQTPGDPMTLACTPYLHN
ncbi:hypothetical protein Micbo1qcDRAFT_173883 [Microdochium bolleyi]|uniref:Uncharacterized protein n=1 Tax=Microdochium bolleyi TaxID=196109 RepID=A0A136J6A7_9PEZI|nr:hypothetical protein Micbo1qcDRAFT_173883 [Microdochium bolleyi]